MTAAVSATTGSMSLRSNLQKTMMIREPAGRAQRNIAKQRELIDRYMRFRYR